MFQKKRFITIRVIPVPPKLSLSSFVNFESLYGMCVSFLCGSLRAEMHVPYYYYFKSKFNKNKKRTVAVRLNI